MRATKAPEMLRELQARHPGSGLSAAQWDEFMLIYKGDVDKALTGYIVWADQEVAKINGLLRLWEIRTSRSLPMGKTCRQ